MNVSFGIYEDLSDLTEWFIRCVDGTVRDAYRRDYIDDTAIRLQVRNEVKRHNAGCPVCSQTEQGADLEVSSAVDDISDEELDVSASRAVLEALGLPARNGAKIFGCIDAMDMQGRLILALSFVDPQGKQEDYGITNVELLEYLQKIYDITESAVRLEREVVWMEYPTDF